MALAHLDPLIAAGVVLSTAATDAVYVMFNAAVSDRRRVAAASWSSTWYLLSAFAVISYTGNPASEPIQEVRFQEQGVGLINRRSIMRIIARRMNAAADRA